MVETATDWEAGEAGEVPGTKGRSSQIMKGKLERNGSGVWVLICEMSVWEWEG